ncbi:MAG: DoxX family membrane protein [Phycisphaerales bacterium]|jgi:uncharacterized membrane protein YphA (DoxX/SURF4 family)|nr:DoxX family membrane protein [Phycisphaerales bacterium]
MSWKKWILLILRLGVAGVFIYAGAVKLADPLRFATQIRAYELTGFVGGAVLAVWLPWLELLCGLALLANRMVSGSLLWLVMLMLIFTAAQASAMVRGLRLDCGCFGGSDATIHPLWLMGRDLLILLVVLALSWIKCRCATTQK